MFFKEKWAARQNNSSKNNRDDSTARDNTVATIIWWLKYITGVTFDDECVYILWPARICISFYLYTFSFQFIGTVNVRNDPDELFEFLSILTFSGIGILKLISLVHNNKQWNYLLKTVNYMETQQLNYTHLPSVEYESDSETDSESKFKDHIQRYTNRFKRVFGMVYKLYLMTVIVYNVAPFMQFTITKISGFEEVKLPHILPGWNPLDKITFGGYLVTIIMEIIASFYCVCAHFIFDLISVAMCIAICGQFSILRKYSENIAGAGRNLSLSQARDKRAHYRIIQCHRMHIILTKATDTLRNLLKNILGVYFFIAIVTMCSVAVTVNGRVLTVVQMIKWFQYMLGLLTQLFIFCFFGDNVISQSSVGTGEGPSAAAYWCVSPKIRKELLILTMGMSQPQRLHAGPFIFVNLPSFVQIIRTTYSYYAVIRD